MPQHALTKSEGLDLPTTPVGDSPRHGFRGAHDPARSPMLPLGLSIALSREAGARGGTIAKRAGAKLGWQVYTQDLIEYMAQEGNARPDLLGPQPAGVLEWVDQQMNRLLKEQNLSRNPSVLELARTVLTLAAQGEAVLLGRGAGCILPAHSTLNVRLVAPLTDRVAYMSQWLRMTEEEAAEQVRKRDVRRGEFITTHFHRKPADVHQYDMVLNSSLLGEERCAELIVQAARAKVATFLADEDF